MSGFEPFGQRAIWLFLGHGLAQTVKAAGFSIALSLVVGALVAAARLSGTRLLAWPAAVFALAIRSVPSYLILLTVFFGAYAVGVRLSALVAIVLGLALYHGAKVSEIARGAFQSVERGQVEAARSLGLSHGQTLRTVVWPQAVGRLQPPLASECILCVKNTSLGSLVGLDEVLKRGEIVYQKYVNPMETLMVIGAIYWVICFSLSLVSRRVEGAVSWTGE